MGYDASCGQYVDMMDAGIVDPLRVTRGALEAALSVAGTMLLTEAGILPENISVADLCTKCNEAHFFSHRRQGAVRGTMSAMIEV